MYETDEGEAEGASRAEAALVTVLRGSTGRIDVRRPQGSWLIEAVHGRRADSWPAADQPAMPDPPALSDAGPESAASEAIASEAGVPSRELSAEARLLEEGAGWLETAVELERGLAQLAGARVRALASFARCRPSSFDRQPGERGAASAASRAARPAALTEVSEWAVDEVAAQLRLPGRTASGLLVEAIELVEELPDTLAALERGDITWAQARALVELLRSVSGDKKALVEARVLPRAPQQTVAQLRECARRAIARIDADAALRRVAEAIRGRKVTRHAGEDGMAVLTALLPGPVARACYDALRAYAQACAVDEDGRPDPRSLDERMADCLADLILRPDAEGRSPVKVILTVIARVGTLTGTGPDADEPGEVDGETVPAALIRELAYALGLVPRPAALARAVESGEAAEAAEAFEFGKSDEALEFGEAVEPASTAMRTAPAECAAPVEADSGAEGASPAETAGPADDSRPGAGAGSARDAARTDSAAPAEDSDEAVRAQAALAALLDLRRLADTALAERSRIAVVDDLTGCLSALTDSTELRRAAGSGRGLGPPGETAGYRPSDPLDRFVRLRDRRCRFPGCRARIRACDVDHLVPHPHGPTAHHNLEGLCEHHHRLSHQAPGWRLGGASDGGLVWTLPGGATITTVPPAFGTDDGSAPSSPAAAHGAAGRSWRELSPEQRRARIRALVDPGRDDAARDPDDPPPF